MASRPVCGFLQMRRSPMESCQRPGIEKQWAIIREGVRPLDVEKGVPNAHLRHWHDPPGPVPATRSTQRCQALGLSSGAVSCLHCSLTRDIWILLYIHHRRRTILTFMIQSILRKWTLHQHILTSLRQSCPSLNCGLIVCRSWTTIPLLREISALPLSSVLIRTASINSSTFAVVTYLPLMLSLVVLFVLERKN